MNARQMYLLVVGERVSTISVAPVSGVVKARTNNSVLIHWDDGIEDGWLDMDRDCGQIEHEVDAGEVEADALRNASKHARSRAEAEEMELRYLLTQPRRPRKV